MIKSILWWITLPFVTCQTFIFFVWNVYRVHSVLRQPISSSVLKTFFLLLLFHHDQIKSEIEQLRSFSQQLMKPISTEEQKKVYQRLLPYTIRIAPETERLSAIKIISSKICEKSSLLQSFASIRSSLEKSKTYSGMVTLMIQSTVMFQDVMEELQHNTYDKKKEREKEAILDLIQPKLDACLYVQRYGSVMIQCLGALRGYFPEHRWIQSIEKMIVPWFMPEPPNTTIRQGYEFAVLHQILTTPFLSLPRGTIEQKPTLLMQPSIHQPIKTNEQKQTLTINTNVTSIYPQPMVMSPRPNILDAIQPARSHKTPILHHRGDSISVQPLPSFFHHQHTSSTDINKTDVQRTQTDTEPEPQTTQNNENPSSIQHTYTEPSQTDVPKGKRRLLSFLTRNNKTSPITVTNL